MLDIFVCDHSGVELIFLEFINVCRARVISFVTLYPLQHSWFVAGESRTHKQWSSSSPAIESPIQGKGFSSTFACSYPVSAQAILCPQMCSDFSATLPIP